MCRTMCYLKVAKILKLYQAPDEMIMAFARYFAMQDEHFDFESFTEACGVVELGF